MKKLANIEGTFCEVNILRKFGKRIIKYFAEDKKKF